MRGRIYDPIVGRFTTPDPFVQAPYWSQSLNRYSYAWNNPHKWVDPSGFDGEDGGGDTVTTTELGAKVTTLPEITIYGHVPSGPESNQSIQPEEPNMSTGPAESSNSTAGAPKGPNPGDAPAGASLESSAGQMSTNDMAPAADSTQNGTPSEHVEVSLGYPTGTFGVPPQWRGLAQNQPGGSVATRGMMMLHETVVDSTELGVALGATALVSPFIIATAPAGGAPFSGFAFSGTRAVGGAISGGLSQAIAGRPGSAIARGAAIGFVFSGVNPFGSVGSAAFRSGLNSASTNLINQALRGNGVAFAPVMISGLGGAAFGSWYGNTSAAELGIPIQGMIMENVSKGVASGLVSGAVGPIVNF